ncbi:mitochondrial ribosomal protein L1 [Arctopsyche grandis]|uniref:mitochondrial ribosomal protein L1 n=1 Tax=Arctopsyche grandis TaxID=121162 RepID=UPI00406D7062
MMALSSVLTAKMPNLFRSVFIQPSIQMTCQRMLSLSSIDFAARKGTREKARKKKVKVEVKKLDFASRRYGSAKKSNKKRVDRHISDELKPNRPPPHVEVYARRFFKRQVHTIEEAVNSMKETHHPTMFNAPDALVNIFIELNIETTKKNRYMDNFFRTALLPHPFQISEDRRILVFCKDLDLQKKVITAGATVAGGTEIIKDIQSGQLKLVDFDYILAHSQILTDIIPLRGLMKKRFPSEKIGTLGHNIEELVTQFRGGVQYKSQKDEQQKNFSKIVTPIGKLGMEVSHLEANIDKLLIDVNEMRPNKPGLFITKCYLTSPPGTEKLRINPFNYIREPESSTSENKKTKSVRVDVDSDSDDEIEKVEAEAAGNV